MASALSFAQHFIECGNCEENPAQFLCKTCSGHLCVGCKSEHENRKIFQNHDIIHLGSERGGMLELLHCSEHRNEHRNEKLIWYCSPCQTPICTQCMMGNHNGHKVENLAPVYYRIKDQFLKEKEEIDKTLLPKYEELLAKENEKEADISKRTDEVQRQIENHTEDIIKRFTVIKEMRIHDLRQEEKKALHLLENSKTEIKRRMKKLTETKTKISNNLSAKPGNIFFKATNSNSLNELRRYPDTIEYKLDNFSPCDIERILQRIDFGSAPSFRMVGSTRDIDFGYTPRYNTAALEKKAPLKKGKKPQIDPFLEGDLVFI